MEREEALFRAYEREIVQERLERGFAGDVDEFIRFSLSVHNRRKSRVGHAFENHLTELFERHGLRFEKGGVNRVTENKSKPDFLFPGFTEYHDPQFPNSRLFLLGAKTTCKERWRQVLAEGERLKRKHLATLEPGISRTHTDEMSAHGLQLVVPLPIHATYSETQRMKIMGIQDFISHVRPKVFKTRPG
nr:type II restriction endonuclease [Halorhodospira halophila]